MIRAALLGTLLLGCASRSFPPPSPDRAQVVVELAAAPKAGLRWLTPGAESPYPTLPDPAFERVDYRRLADIAVVLRGPGLDDQGPAPRAATLAAGRSGFDHALVLLAPGGLLKLANRRSAPLTLFAAGAGGEGFDVTVPAGGTAEARLAAPGRYEVHCEEDPALEAEVLVAETTWAQSGRAGDALCFDRLPPGRYEVIATAPRLPQWTGHVEAAAGARATVHAELSVNRLPPAARP